MIRLLSCFLIVTVVTGCNTGGPGFRGVAPRTAEVEGSRFILRRRSDVVEAIRTSPEWLPRLAFVARKAAIAAEDMTGCKATWVQGDPAMMLIGMSCDGARPPAMPKRKQVLECDLSDFSSRDGIGSGSLSCIKG
jgi:hypothetical protein